MPSLQSSIVSELDPADVIIVGLNHTTSKEWLINYSVQKSLTFPILYDASGIYDEYQIGFGYG
ncbi:MAG: hypothetical protein GY863_05270, partial [bacterium]|nr:hypothetical protein [bacterium]